MSSNSLWVTICSNEDECDNVTNNDMAPEWLSISEVECLLLIFLKILPYTVQQGVKGNVIKLKICFQMNVYSRLSKLKSQIILNQFDNDNDINPISTGPFFDKLFPGGGIPPSGISANVLE